ncbi:7TM GPCR protein [Aphelenchoides avenae]|nr:7TM GPCR protein [Aphelenchus avenae]
MDDTVLESSVFYIPAVARTSAVVIDVSFVLSSLMFPVMLWLILRHSRKMGKYRWYMLVNVLLCYASDFLLTLVKPVFLGSMIGWFLQGFVPASASTSSLLVFVLMCVLNAMEFSIGSSLLYRFAQSYFGRIRDFFEGPKPLVAYAVIVIGSVGYLSPIVWVRFESDDAMRQYAANYSDFLIPFTRLNGFYAFERTVMAECFLYVVVNNLFICVILCAFLHLVFLLRLRSERFIRTQSKTNLRLQMMLFRTISFQLLLALVLLAFPALIALLITALNVPHSGSITTLLFTAVSLHATLEFLGICYFVAPYRRAIVALTARLMKRKIRGVTSRDANTATLFTTRKDSRRPTYPSLF